MWNTDPSDPADAQGARTFQYDPDTLALTNEVLVAGGVTTSLARAYDSLGRSAGYTLGGTNSVSSGYDYDTLGRFASVTWSGVDNVYTATYAYVVNSDLIAGYDVNVGTNVYKTRKTFEPNRNLMSAVSNLWNTAEVSTYAYGNDAIGRRTNRIDSGASSATNTFGYNIRSELTAAEMGTNDYGYVYDPIGNRESYTNNAEVWTYLSNELNQYTNIADGVTNTPTYDLDGNMLTHNGWTFEWNGENRLVSASNGATVVTFAYDYMGRRFMKATGGVTNRYTYDGWAMIRETISNDLSPMTNDFIYGLDLSGSMQGAGTIGGLLAATLGGTTSVSSVFYAYDANGNVTELLNTNGTTAARYQYDPFGNIIRQTGPAAIDNPFRFSTKYHDDETGLVYYGYRFYSPELGRWLNRDPIGERGGLNVYGFVGNRPVLVFDVLGRYVYEFNRIDDVAQSGGMIGLVDIPLGTFWIQGRVEREPSIASMKGTLNESRCTCCMEEIEFKFKQTMYVPIIGDTMGQYGELDADQVSRIDRHEYWHVWANWRIGNALYPKGESECKGRCWSKEEGATYSQSECDSLVKEKAQAVIDFVDGMMIAAGHHLHNIIGDDAIASPMPTFDQTYQYISNVRGYIDYWMSNKTFCNDGF